MATDLIVVLEDRRGTLADNGEVSGCARVNVDDLAAITANVKSFVHILVEDAGAAGEVLKSACIEVGKRATSSFWTLETSQECRERLTARLLHRK